MEKAEPVLKACYFIAVVLCRYIYLLQAALRQPGVEIQYIKKQTRQKYSGEKKKGYWPTFVLSKEQTGKVFIARLLNRSCWKRFPYRTSSFPFFAKLGELTQMTMWVEREGGCQVGFPLRPERPCHLSNPRDEPLTCSWCAMVSSGHLCQGTLKTSTWMRGTCCLAALDPGA